LRLLEHSRLQDPESAILALLCINNKAEILFDKGDYQQTGVCLEFVSSLMAKAALIANSLDEAEVEGLRLNRMLFTPPTCAKAA
jgi:hypothetical protein